MGEHQRIMVTTGAKNSVPTITLVLIYHPHITTHLYHPPNVPISPHNAHTHTHACIHTTYMQTHTHTLHTHTQHTHTHTHMHTHCIHTHTLHTLTHTHTHTHTHTYTHTAYTHTHTWDLAACCIGPQSYPMPRMPHVSVPGHPVWRSPQ